MTGTLTGIVDLRWVAENNKLIYTPDPDNPLRYENGPVVIQPTRMWTDLGSIPQALWSIPGLDPWTYGPAFVIHDTAYNEHRCGRDLCTFEQANAALGDCIDILIARGQAKAHFAAKHMILAALAIFGRKAWNEACVLPPPAEKLMAARGRTTRFDLR